MQVDILIALKSTLLGLTLYTLKLAMFIFSLVYGFVRKPSKRSASESPKELLATMLPYKEVKQSIINS